MRTRHLTPPPTGPATNRGQAAQIAGEPTTDAAALDIAALLTKQADDPDKVRKAVDDQASSVAALWITFLGFTAYLAITVGTVDSRALFFEEPLNLPLINVKVPLIIFAWLAPILLIVFQAYLLLALKLLQERVACFEDLLAATANKPDLDARLRKQLPGSVFVQWQAKLGTRRWIPAAVAWLTVFVGPLLLLLTFEAKYLPLQDQYLTLTHMALFAIDVLLLWLIWRNNAEFRPWPRGQRLRLSGELAASIIVAVAFTVAAGNVVPSHLDLSNQTLVDVATVEAAVRDARAAGNPLWQHTPAAYEVRNRNLSHAVFNDADLRMVAFVNVDLSVAHFERAKLNGARFECAVALEVGSDPSAPRKPDPDLTDARRNGSDRECSSLNASVMRGATLDQARIAPDVDARLADFRRASAVAADFSGANLSDAKFDNTVDCTNANPRDAKCDENAVPPDSAPRTALRSARFDNAILNGAIFDRADLRASSFLDAKARGASFEKAILLGSRFEGATLWAATFTGATLVAANMKAAKLWAASFSGADLTDADLTSATLYGANFYGATLHHVVFQSASIWQIDLDSSHLDASWWPTGKHHGDPKSLIRAVPALIEPRLESEPTIDTYARYVGVWLSQTISVDQTRFNALNSVNRGLIGHWLWRKAPSRRPLPFLSGDSFHKRLLAKRLAALACTVGDLFEGLLHNQLLQQASTYQDDVLRLMDQVTCHGVITEEQRSRLRLQLASLPAATGKAPVSGGPP